MREPHEHWEWLHVTPSSLGDTVITTDTNGSVTLLNPVAQSVKGNRMHPRRGGQGRWGRPDAQALAGALASGANNEWALSKIGLKL